MIIERANNKRCLCRTKAESPIAVYAWGALQVTLKVQGNDNDHYYVTMSKEELVEALAKITAREDEIRLQMEGATK